MSTLCETRELSEQGSQSESMRIVVICVSTLIYILIDQNSQKKHLTTMKGSLIGKKGQPKHSSSLTFDTNEG